MKAYDSAGYSRQAWQEALAIDPLNLQAAFIRLPGHLAIANAQYFAALGEYLRAEHVLEKTCARLAIQYRETNRIAGLKVTEAQVKEHINAHPEYENARFDFIESEIEKASAKGRVAEIEAKKDALISLGAHIRQEMAGNLSLREQHQFRSEHPIQDSNNTDE